MKKASALKIPLGLLSFLVFLLGSCHGTGKGIIAPDFNGPRAFSYLEKQVSFGPRVPGTIASQNCRHYLVGFFDSLGVPVDTIVFDHVDKITRKNIRMVNIIAHLAGTGGAAAENYMVAAHYDSRPRADYDPDSTRREMPISGANDGASGVAVAMELANLMTSTRPRVNVDLYLLDGEDWGKSGDIEEYFLGARAMLDKNIKGKYKFAILVDMIGDRDLKIYREEYSDRYAPQLTDLIWHTAAELGENAFVDSVGYAVQDDHLSFLTIDLPTAVIIDFNYPYWHTSMDTPDKCSPQSLKAVGHVVSTILYGL